ncbi:MAG: cobalamin-dependent protein, partial [Catenulispora sp.]
DGVDVEHAFSEALLAAMRGVVAAGRRPRNTHPVLLTCAEGDYHTLPLHVLAAALAQEGIGCRMLGVGMPPDALIAAVRRTGPAVVFAYARMQVTDAGVLAELRRQRPTPRIVIGGTGWSERHAVGAVLPVATLGAALEAVLTAVRV